LTPFLHFLRNDQFFGAGTGSPSFRHFVSHSPSFPLPFAKKMQFFLGSPIRFSFASLCHYTPATFFLLRRFLTRYAAVLFASGVGFLTASDHFWRSLPPFCFLFLCRAACAGQRLVSFTTAPNFAFFCCHQLRHDGLLLFLFRYQSHTFIFSSSIESSLAFFPPV